MTQLDRLEALAEKAKETLEQPWTDEDAAFLLITLKTLPDLIRVARAAKALCDDEQLWTLVSIGASEADPDQMPNSPAVLSVALAPLYREVEG